MVEHPESRILVMLPSGRRVWMLPGQIRTSGGASNMPLGNRWQDIARQKLPDSCPEMPAPARASRNARSAAA